MTARYNLLGNHDMGINVIQAAVLTVLGVVIVLRAAKDGQTATSEARGGSAIGERSAKQLDCVPVILFCISTAVFHLHVEALAQVMLY
jgi:hypothetical protein